MPLSVNFLQNELYFMNPDAKGAGDTIGIAITNYLNNMFPIISGVLKNELDTTFINTLNSSTYLNPLPTVLINALDIYKLRLIPIISSQNPGFAAIPPPLPAPVEPIFLLPQTKESFANSFSVVIDNWFRTGTYTISGGPPINWN